MDADLAAPPEPTREELHDHWEQEVLRARDEAMDEGTGDTEATELTDDDDVTDATDIAPPRRSERSTNRPSKYVAAQLKECGKPKECGKLKECTTGIKECKQGVSLTQLEHCHNIMVEDDSTFKEVFYSQESAKVMARYIVEIHQGASNHAWCQLCSELHSSEGPETIWRARIQGSWQEGTGPTAHQELLLTP
jgi:hypothetical protein